MNSTDGQPREQGTPPEPTGEAGDEPDDSGGSSVLVVRIREMQLVWIAIGILAVFVVIDSVALLSMRSSKSYDQGLFPGTLSDAASAGYPVSGRVEPRDPYDQTDGAVMEAGQGFSPDRLPRSAGTDPGNEYLALATGKEAVSRVEAFIADYELGKDDADALMDAVKETNKAIETLEAQKSSGEIDGPTYETQVEREQENQRLKVLQLIGWQSAAKLYERLRINEPGTVVTDIEPPEK